MSNSLDPAEARSFVGPDLGPNCLQRLSADVTSTSLVGKELTSELVFSFTLVIFRHSDDLLTIPECSKDGSNNGHSMSQLAPPTTQQPVKYGEIIVLG